MRTKKIARLLVLFIMTLLLLIMPGNGLLSTDYPAQITAEGTLTLKDMRKNSDISLTIETNFTALVPKTVVPGAYTADFGGFAHTFWKGLIKFDGLLTVEGYNFWVKFAAEKPVDLEVPEGIYSANGTLSIVISELSLPEPQVTWVLMKGKVTSYGGNEAFGHLIAHAKIGQWTKVHGSTTQQPPPLEESRPQNFSYSFYAFRLVNATATEVNSDGKALHIAGFWNVYNVTCTRTDNVQFTITVTMVVQEAFGELNVTLEPALFTLDISGIQQISGEVVFYHLKFGDPFMRGIPLGDFNKDRRVDVRDITTIAKAFGSKPGMPVYDFALDIDFDYTINIRDLTTVAQEFGEEY